MIVRATALQRVAATFSALVSGQVIVRFGGLLLVPLFLHRWSPTEYGEWLALSAIAGYLTLIDPAIHLAAVNALTRLHAQGDVAAFRRVQRSSLGAYVVLAMGGTVLIAVAAFYLPVPSWLGVRVMSGDAALVMTFVGAYVLWCMPSRLIFGIYPAIGSAARQQWASNVQQAFSIASTALVLWLGGGMVALAILQFTIMVIATTLAVIDLRRRAPEYAPRFSLAHLRDVRGLVKPGAFFSMMSLANLVTQQGSIVVLSAALGGSAVALFSVSRTVVMLPRQAIEALSWALWPEVARLDATRGGERVRLLHKALVGVSVAIPIAFAAGLWYEGPALLGLWTRGRLAPDETLLRLLLALAIFQAPWVTGGLFTMAVNRHQAFAAAYLGASLTGLAVAWSVLGWLGVLALPVGLAAGEALCGYHFAVRATCRMLGEGYGAFAVRLWSMVGLLALGGVLLAAAIHGVALPAPLRALVATSLTAAMAVAVFWWGWLTASERAGLVMRARVAWQPTVAVSPPA